MGNEIRAQKEMKYVSMSVSVKRCSREGKPTRLYPFLSLENPCMPGFPAQEILVAIARGITSSHSEQRS